VDEDIEEEELRRGAKFVAALITHYSR
jgi:hypothetical protein